MKTASKTKNRKSSTAHTDPAMTTVGRKVWIKWCIKWMQHRAVPVCHSEVKSNTKQQQMYGANAKWNNSKENVMRMYMQFLYVWVTSWIGRTRKHKRVGSFSAGDWSYGHSVCFDGLESGDFGILLPIFTECVILPVHVNLHISPNAIWFVPDDIDRVAICPVLAAST